MGDRTAELVLGWTVGARMGLLSGGLSGAGGDQEQQPGLGPTCWLLPAHQECGSEAGTQPAVLGNRSS